MDFWRIFIFLMILIIFLGDWKNYRKKFKDAEGEEELRHAVVRFILIIVLFILAIAVFIF